MSKKLGWHAMNYINPEDKKEDNCEFPPTKPSGYSEPKLEGHSSFLKLANTRMVKNPLLEVYNEERAMARLRDSLQEEKGIQPCLNDKFKDGRIPVEFSITIKPKDTPPKPVETIEETSKQDLEKAEALGYLKALRFVLNYLHTKELGDDEFAWLEEQIREHCKNT